MSENSNVNLSAPVLTEAQLVRCTGQFPTLDDRSLDLHLKTMQEVHHKEVKVLGCGVASGAGLLVAAMIGDLIKGPSAAAATLAVLGTTLMFAGLLALLGLVCYQQTFVTRVRREMQRRGMLGHHAAISKESAEEPVVK